MNDSTQAALQAAVLKVLADRVNTAQKHARYESAESMTTGDRVNPTVNGEHVASVTKTKPRTTARVTDMAAFTNWCLQHHPTEVVTQARESWVNTVLQTSKKAGEPCAPDGTLDIPGIEVNEGDPGLTVRLSERAEELVMILWSRGEIDLSGVRELEAGDE